MHANEDFDPKIEVITYRSWGFCLPKLLPVNATEWWVSLDEMITHTHSTAYV